jgi:succinate dehydrogenase / fumarate reductase cytochrome b subunit
MPWWNRLINSSVGLKSLMAVTGLLLVGFVILHMIGNLNAYRGADALNSYAQTLKNFGPLLWVARLGLLSIFIVHLAAAFRLTAIARKARPIAYAFQKPIVSTFASRTMMMSGLIILFFLLYHLAHFTFHWFDDYGAWTDAQGRQDVYRMFVTGFQNPLASLFYVVANVLLGLHLSHAIQSLFQTLGIKSNKFAPLIKCGGVSVAWLVAGANISFPVSVLLGVIHL